MKRTWNSTLNGNPSRISVELDLKGAQDDKIPVISYSINIGDEFTGGYINLDDGYFYLSEKYTIQRYEPSKMSDPKDNKIFTRIKVSKLLLKTLKFDYNDSKGIVASEIKRIEAEGSATIKILHQGAMLINRAFIHAYGNYVCAIVVDMKSKRGDILCTGSDDDIPTVAIEACNSSTNLNKKVKGDEPTEIAFPDFKGWNVWSAMVCKYSIYVCLVKS